MIAKCVRNSLLLYIISISMFPYYVRFLSYIIMFPWSSGSSASTAGPTRACASPPPPPRPSPSSLRSSTGCRSALGSTGPCRRAAGWRPWGMWSRLTRAWSSRESRWRTQMWRSSERPITSRWIHLLRLIYRPCRIADLLRCAIDRLHSI